MPPRGALDGPALLVKSLKYNQHWGRGSMGSAWLYKKGFLVACTVVHKLVHKEASRMARFLTI